MNNCVNCGCENATYKTKDNKNLCENCVWEFFNCASCQGVFVDWSMDSGNGVCKECNK